MSCRIIGLITDFGSIDWFVGVMKAVMLSINPSASIIEVTNGVPRQNIKAAAFAVLASYRFLPPESIIVIVVDPGVGSERSIICAKAAGRYFLAPDNGVLSPLLERERPEQMVRVSNSEFFLRPVSSTFHGRDIFAPVAAHLSLDLELGKLGPPVEQYEKVSLTEADFDGKQLRLEALWIDSFGNIVTNCSSRVLAKVVARLGCDLLIEGYNRRFRICDFYGACQAGDLIGLVGSTGNLEISIVLGSAAEALGARVGDEFVITKIE